MAKTFKFPGLPSPDSAGVKWAKIFGEMIAIVAAVAAVWDTNRIARRDEARELRRSIPILSVSKLELRLSTSAGECLPAPRHDLEDRYSYRVTVRNVGVGPALIRASLIASDAKNLSGRFSDTFSLYDPRTSFIRSFLESAWKGSTYEFNPLLDGDVLHPGDCRVVILFTAPSTSDKPSTPPPRDIRVSVDYESILGASCTSSQSQRDFVCRSPDGTPIF